MVNKKAFLRIVESFVAILIIFVTIIILSTTIKLQKKQPDLTNYLFPILDEIASNYSFRNKILEDGNQNIVAEIEEEIKNKINIKNLNYSVKICNIGEVCILEPYPVENPSDLYSSERVISSNLTYHKPKILKLFVWRTF